MIAYGMWLHVCILNEICRKMLMTISCHSKKSESNFVWKRRSSYFYWKIVRIYAELQKTDKSENIIQMSKRVGKLKLSIKLSQTAKIVDPRKSSLVNVYKSSFISVSLLQFQSKINFSISISKSFLTKRNQYLQGCSVHNISIFTW